MPIATAAAAPNSGAAQRENAMNRCGLASAANMHRT